VTKTLFTNIGSLVMPATEVGVLETLSNAAFVVEDGLVAWVGDVAAAPSCDLVVDVAGACVIPGFVDSHAHLMFAGSREQEFAARMAGVSYSAGGIKTTVAKTRAASDEELRSNAQKQIAELYKSGVTHFEIKSGYGLDVETELRSLKIAREFTEDTTFLGAHVVPQDQDPQRYVDLVATEMLSAVKPYAKWIDVFCDQGAFDLVQTRRVLEAGIAAGLKPRLHANQIADLGAIALAVELDCASVDHCTHLSDSDIELLANGNTVATLLPGAEFSTRSAYPDAKRLFAAGVTVALATDCNPGSSFTTSMPFCIAVAVRDMGFTIDQAVWSATRGGALALRDETRGTLRVGMRADFAILDAPNHLFLAYRPGVQLVTATYVAGKKVYGR
jgi:imidazolonepropionase